MLEDGLLNERAKQRYLRLIGPVSRVFARLGIHPNALTLAGLILSMAAGLVYSTGLFFWGAWAVVLAGSCDALDGHLARLSGKNTKFGAFFDSTLDRFGEVLIFTGLAWHYAGGASWLHTPEGTEASSPSPVFTVLIILIIAGSFMVSYTRARAEGLGVACKVGWMQRPERMTLLVVGSLFGAIPVIGPFFMKGALFILAVLSNATALQRMVFVKNKLMGEKSTPGKTP